MRPASERIVAQGHTTVDDGGVGCVLAEAPALFRHGATPRSAVASLLGAARRPPCSARVTRTLAGRTARPPLGVGAGAGAGAGARRWNQAMRSPGGQPSEAPPVRMTSAYHSALRFGVRCCVA